MVTTESMIQTLTGLLDKGETLMHPIYGALEQGGRQYPGYFGLTERCLIIALISGKRITNTIRVPLDVNSVMIKKNVFLNRHVIDIYFAEGAPCRIVAFPKVITLYSQGENIPRFISYIESKVKAETPPTLNGIEGTKIRRQYFNFFLYFNISVFVPIFLSLSILECKRQNVSAWNFWRVLFGGELNGMLAAPAVMLVILVLLSFGSKYLFGKTVAVVDHKGLYLENAYIALKDIKAVEYTPTHFSKTSFRCAYVSITVAPARKGEYCVEVTGFTLYGLRKLRERLPEHTVRWAKGKLAMTVFVALLPAVMFLGMAIFTQV